MTEREIFITLLDNQPLTLADVIVVLEGDGFTRVTESIRLYKEKFAPRIIVSGGLVKPEIASFPAVILAKELIKNKIPNNNIIIDDQSLHTQAQAESVLRLCQKNKWKSLIIVASHYHHYRAFLTFLQEITKKGYTGFTLQSAPVRNLLWTEKVGKITRLELLQEEFKKIFSYQKKKHVASFKVGINYLCSTKKRKK